MPWSLAPWLCPIPGDERRLSCLGHNQGEPEPDSSDALLFLAPRKLLAGGAPSAAGREQAQGLRPRVLWCWVHQEVRVLSGASLEESEKQVGTATRAEDCGQRRASQSLWKMKIPMALERAQRARAALTRPAHDTPGTAGLALGRSLPNRFFTLPLYSVLTS